MSQLYYRRNVGTTTVRSKKSEEKTQTNGGQESRTKYDVLDFVPPLTKINKYAVVVIIIVLSLSLVVEEKLIFY